MAKVTVRQTHAKIAESLYKETNFTKTEVERLLKMYVQLNHKKPNMRLDRPRLRDLLHNTFNMTDDFLMDRVFRAFDKDLDGYVSLEEWVKGLSTFLRGSLTDRIAFTFCVYDLNSDSLISREEMFQLLKATLIKQPSEEDPDEGVRDLVETTFKKLDVNRDGKLTLEDFEAAVKEEPLLLEVLGHCLPDDKSANAFLATFQEVEVSPKISYVKY